MNKLIKEAEKNYKKHQEETKKIYGEEDSYKESEKRYSKYTQEQKSEIFSKGQQIFLNISNLVQEDPSSDEVQELIQEWRDHITKYFYECTTPILKGLGQMYVQDNRFKENINKIKPGLAEFLNKSIDIYCLNNN